MAETQPGGVYKVGDNYVDAEGKGTKPQTPTTQDGGEGGGGEETYPHADVLTDGGFATWEDVKNASDEDLLAVKGIGPASLKAIRAYKG